MIAEPCLACGEVSGLHKPGCLQEVAERLQRAYEAETDAYFEMLDWACDRFKALEKPQALPVARVYKGRIRR